MATVRFAAILVVAMATLSCSGSTPGESIASLPVLAPAGVSSAPPAGEVLVRAASLVTEQPGYDFTFEAAIAGMPETGGVALAVTGAGTVDQRSNRSRIELDLRALQALIPAEDSTELAALLGDGRIAFVQDGRSFYVRMPYLAREAGASTPWIAMTLPEDIAGTSPGLTPGLLGGLGAAGSPTDYLAQLQEIDPTLRAAGPETVRGVATTRYSGTLDLRRLMGQNVPPEDARQFEAMMPFIEAFKLPYDVWIDGDGFPRRLAAVLDFGSFVPAGTPTSGPTPRLTLTYELFNFGTPDAIALPAASEVTLLDPAVLATIQ